jgi:hypothetical protein
MVVPPETCELPGSPTCDCCFEHGSPGCEDAACESAVCAADSFCCDVEWDTICVEAAESEPACETCCDYLCRDDCTYCGDLIVNGATDIHEQLVANGDFETGGLAPWTTAEQPGSGGMFLISTPGSAAPLSGATTAPNPGGGSFYAIADQPTAGTHALLQSFTVPSGAISVVLSFEMFVADCGLGPIVDPVGLDHTAGPNQHARVDILSATASPFDTGAGVVANLYVGIDGLFGVPYTPYNFDLTGSLTPGTTYQLRFAETLNQCVLNQGVDNLMLRATIPGGPLLEECDPPGSLPGPPRCDCCFVHGSAGCSDATCEAVVCGDDPFCCGVLWDATCAVEAQTYPECTACCFPEICTPDCLTCTDTDLDWICEAEDTCNLSPNPGGGAAVFGQTILAPDRTSFDWVFPEDVVAVRGDLSLVSSYDVLAVDSHAGATSIAAPEVPASGAGLYWLLRPDCDPSSYASGGSGECAFGCPPGERDGNLP